MVINMQNIITLLRSALEEAHYDRREARTIILLLLEEVCSMSHTEAVMTLSMFPQGCAVADSVLALHSSDRQMPSCPTSAFASVSLTSAYKGMEIPLACQKKLVEIGEKLRQGIPVQQALGYEWFCGRRFKVTADVLIPRPETAELMEWILSEKETQQTETHLPLTYVDVGTGSGCIAITLAAALPNANVYGVDISTAALAVAHENAVSLSVDNVSLVHGNILKWAETADNEKGLSKEAAIARDSFSQGYPYSYPQGYPPAYSQSYPQSCSQTCSYLSADTFSDADPFEDHPGVDLIVSNPPYIGMKEKEEMSPLVWAHEPTSALFVPDEDPLLFYRAIARWGKKRLSHGGWLYFEMNVSWVRETVQLMKEEGFVAIEIRQDITGRERMLRCRWP